MAFNNLNVNDAIANRKAELQKMVDDLSQEVFVQMQEFVSEDGYGIESTNLEQISKLNYLKGNFNTLNNALRSGSLNNLAGLTPQAAVESTAHQEDSSNEEALEAIVTNLVPSGFAVVLLPNGKIDTNATLAAARDARRQKDAELQEAKAKIATLEAQASAATLALPAVGSTVNGVSQPVDMSIRRLCTVLSGPAPKLGKTIKVDYDDMREAVMNLDATIGNGGSYESIINGERPVTIITDVN